MKRIAVLATIALLLPAGIFAQNSAKDIYSKYSDRDNVSAVFISSSMFRLMGKLPSMSIAKEDMDLSNMVRNLERMYVLDCDDQELIRELKSDVKTLTEKHDYDLLIEVKEEGETARILVLGDDSTVTSFIMTADDGNDGFTFISLEGTLNRSDLEKVIAQTAKNAK